MNDQKDSARHLGLRALAPVIGIILLPFAYSIISSTFGRSDETGQPFLEPPAPQYQECVRDTQYMRFHHWELLNEIREAAVRHGERGDVNLASCRRCHPNRQRFCNQCHAAASVRLDCWGCHYYPETPEGLSEEATGPPAQGALQSVAKRTDRVPEE